MNSVAPQSIISRKKLPFVPQLTLSNSTVNPHLNMPFALPMPLKIRRSQFAPNNHTTNNSHSINKCAAKAVQMSDNKEFEHSEQINPIKPINGIKSNNPTKYCKLSAKTQISKYKYNQKRITHFLPKIHSHFTPLWITLSNRSTQSTLSFYSTRCQKQKQQDQNRLQRRHEWPFLTQPHQHPPQTRHSIPNPHRAV